MGHFHPISDHHLPYAPTVSLIYSTFCDSSEQATGEKVTKKGFSGVCLTEIF